MKKILLTVAVYMTFVLPSFGFDFPTTPSPDSTSCSVLSRTLLTELIEDNLVQSNNVLKMSQDLKMVSENINNTDSVSREYLLAMLRLSDDIGEMAGRIGVMADRIVATEVLIGDMADRIVQVAEILISKNAQTQLNLLRVQENFNALLAQLN